jgi:hypothetical protein
MKIIITCLVTLMINQSYASNNENNDALNPLNSQTPQSYSITTKIYNTWQYVSPYPLYNMGKNLLGFGKKSSLPVINAPNPISIIFTDNHGTELKNFNENTPFPNPFIISNTLTLLTHNNDDQQNPEHDLFNSIKKTPLKTYPFIDPYEISSLPTILRMQSEIRATNENETKLSTKNFPIYITNEDGTSSKLKTTEFSEINL